MNRPDLLDPEEYSVHANPLLFEQFTHKIRRGWSRFQTRPGTGQSQNQGLMKEYAIITGASAGLGLEFARKFARRSTNSVIVARSEDKLREIASELKSGFGVESIPLPLDIADPLDRNRLVKYRMNNNLNVAYLVNSAGYGSNGDFSELDVANEMRMTELSCVAVQESSHRFIGMFRRRRSGTRVSIASTASFQPVPCMATYSATKAFVLNFSMELGRELTGSGANVIALCPGPVETSFFRNAGMKKPKSFLKVHPPQFVVPKAFKSIDGGKSFIVTGTLNSTLHYLGSVMPLSFRTWVAGKMFRPGRKRGKSS